MSGSSVMDSQSCEKLERKMRNQFYLFVHWEWFN